MGEGEVVGEEEEEDPASAADEGLPRNGQGTRGAAPGGGT